MRHLFDDYIAHSRARIESETVNEPEPHVEFVFRSDYPPPPEWGPIIGDCVHNLRSSLDHLAFALPRDPKAKVKQEDIYFPCWFGWRPDHKYLRGLSAGALQAMKELHAFDRSNPTSAMWYPWPRKMIPGATLVLESLHPLDILRELSNTDKHRQLVVGVAMNWHLSWQGQGIEPTVINQGPAIDGEAVVVFPASTVTPKFREAHFDIAFGEGTVANGLRSIQTIDMIVRFVRERVIHTLQPFAAASPPSSTDT